MDCNSYKHGLTGSPIYRLYYQIKSRCYNPKNIGFHLYGGRGIRMCRPWLGSVVLFYNWCIENGWESGLQIDRRNVNGPYSPSNCRFVDKITNARNKRNNLYVKYKGKKTLLLELAEESGIEYNTLKSRLYHNWPIDRLCDDLARAYRGSPVIQKSNGKVISIHKNISEAAYSLKGSKQNISSVLNGRQKTAYGYHWEYKTNYKPKK